MTEPKNVSLAGDEAFLPAVNLIYNWRSTWVRAIARAWVDEEFKKLLVEDAKQAFEKMGFTGTSEILSDGEVDLWNLLDVEVKLADDNPDNQYVNPGDSTDANVEQFTHNGWYRAVEEGLLKMKLTLTLPPEPSDPKWNALALGDYEAAGKIYPITGC
ncbi:hypothetical protein CWB99_11955 [Pseudoalteromonas rubra]|uniref:Nitrile hydratase alpha/Thiocyanate hydrolase gamma domain-containing protein n=1 Tax=Pseudoalteromonas rubra TaxID=43658 RepID=A0A5S3WL99_9GAMM|nr:MULTISPECIES: nitrile hydratase subunit alpha [Pseudoalteromonas]AZZ95637.1 hypothetical protein ELR70_00015 [Pseudoalteromonas sp. R3]TMP28423.1 hypothetical protein CWB99_11955 [Pseudoalteromonas rubra]TMP37174.1 hypothetical protein CWC00_00040 [Pseudoalteromonas rubra]TMP38472.1 hypothetical protein CWB98_07005 [Pseudoalteromonas rubra]